MFENANVTQDEQRAVPKPRRALCLLLLALAWFQLSYATHQFEHVAGDIAGACAVCTQLERLDTAAFFEPAEAPAAAPIPLALTTARSVVVSAPGRRYEPRAPPAT